MKSLFDKDERYSSEGNKLSSELSLAMSSIMNKWIERGHKIREVESVAHGVVLDVALSNLLEKQHPSIKDKE